MFSPVAIPLETQLITPPPTSNKLLEDTSRGSAAPPYGPGEAIAADTARGWTQSLVKAPYAPTTGVSFLAFPNESGAFDIIRARYVASGTTIEVAQTISLASLIVTTTPEERRLPCLARAQQIADRVLALTKPLELVQTDVDGDTVYGSPRMTTRGAYPNWEVDLRWWCSPERVGFLVLKGDGAPMRLRVSYDPSSNAVWFKLMPP